MFSTKSYAQGNLAPTGAPAATMKTLDQVEPRTPVDEVNTPGIGTYTHRIQNSGSYYLTSNLEVTNTHGILITSDRVTLDLNGFTIEKVSGSGGRAIEVSASNGRIVNGQITGFEHGVFGGAAQHVAIHDVMITDLTGNGIQLAGQAHIENCLIDDVDGIGIQAGVVSMVKSCTLHTIGSNGIDAAETSIVEGNIINNCHGHSIYADNRCHIFDNICDFPTSFGAGIFLTSNQGESRVENNSIMRRDVGIQILGPDNYVSGNIVQENNDNYDFAPDNHLNLLLGELPEVLDWPCHALLAGSLTGINGAHGITVNSDDVTIDLGGHALIGSSSSRNGIEVSVFDKKNITFRNGTIRDWPWRGVSALTAENGLVESLHVYSNGWQITQSGLEVGRNFLVKDCVAQANSLYGINTQDGSTVLDCTSKGNGNTGILVGKGCVVESCITISNLSNGISVDQGSTVRDCASAYNDGHGIHATADSLITENVCEGNGNGAGIYAIGTCRVDENHVTDNMIGVHCINAGNLIVRNSAHGNTTNFVFITGNRYGPIVDLTLAIQPPVSGSSAADTTTNHPWANFVH